MPKKQPAHDRNLLSIVGAVSVALGVGFAFVWFYLQYADKQSREINYLSLPSISISRDGHSIAASFAVRISAADAAWASRNKQALEQVMKQALLDVDPVRARAPNGLAEFQVRLRDAGNGMLQTSRIQEVLVTDFLVSEGDL